MGKNNTNLETLTHQQFIDSLIGNLVAENENLLEIKRQKKLTKALEKAYDIRKFELDLYWKRATYFWGFLIAIFAAFFIVIDPSKKINSNYQILIICLGLLFALAWYLVNRGSTYWVTNYERIIDAIEQYKGQSFYNLNLVKDEKSTFKNSAYPFSVSRINITISLFIVLVWLGLFSNFIFNYISSKKVLTFFYLDFKICLIISVTIYFIIKLLLTESHFKNSDYKFLKRQSFYNKNKKPITK